uniref:pejvakin n=1 Tax=Myxine glutinosa TaxID=7769 RepID=UPI00358F453D
MFAAATKSFVQQVGSDGHLVPVPSLSEADKFLPLGLVTKIRSACFWKKVKHTSTPFTLKDILVGPNDLKTEVSSYQLLNYEAQTDLNVRGHRSPGHSEGARNRGADSLAVRASFGIVSKHELNVPHLLRALCSRTIDLDYCLVRQTRASRRTTLAVVIQCIRTTRQCALAIHTGRRHRLIRRSGLKDEENGRHMNGRDKTLVIPAHTPIAFSAFELYISLDGTFDVCVSTELQGGFQHEELGSSLNRLLFRLLHWRRSPLSLRSAPEGSNSPYGVSKATYEPSSLGIDLGHLTPGLSDMGESGMDTSCVELRANAHQRINLLTLDVPKGPCALCGLGLRRRDTVYGCTECTFQGDHFVRLHVVPCFDLWHRQQKV